MKQASNLGCVLSVFAIVALGFAPPDSQARKPRPTPAPISASGGFSDCSVVTDTRPISGNSLLTVSVTENFTGTFNGSFTGTEYDFVHPDGSAVFYGSGVFTGTVAGKTGTFKMTYIGQATSDDTFTSHWIIHEGTGELLNLFGDGTAQGAATSPTTACAEPSAGTYKGQLFFAGRR